MTSREIIKVLKANGWTLANVTGSHFTFKHPTNPNLVTVKHPRKDFPRGTLRAMEKASGLKFGGR